MSLDILLAVGIGLTQLAITWYGIDVSVREHRIKNAVFIGLIGLLGIGLTVFATIRNGVTQEHLQAQLDKIQKNTEQPPRVTVNVPPQEHPPLEGRTWIDMASFWADGQAPPFKAGGSLALNVAFRNNPGSVPATQFRNFQRAIERDHRLNQKEEDAEFYTFLKEARAAKDVPARTLAPGALVYFTIPRLKPFTSEEIAQMTALKLWTYFFALATYTDEKGRHESELCVLYSGSDPVAVNCGSHNGPTL